MARSKVTVKVKASGIRAIMSGPGARALVHGRAEATTAACNAQSSVGGYVWGDASDEVRARARVWDTLEPSSVERHNRMVRNL